MCRLQEIFQSANSILLAMATSNVSFKFGCSCIRKISSLPQTSITAKDLQFATYADDSSDDESSTGPKTPSTPLDKELAKNRFDVEDEGLSPLEAKSFGYEEQVIASGGGLSYQLEIEAATNELFRSDNRPKQTPKAVLGLYEVEKKTTNKDPSSMNPSVSIKIPSSESSPRASRSSKPRTRPQRFESNTLPAKKIRSLTIHENSPPPAPIIQVTEDPSYNHECGECTRTRKLKQLVVAREAENRRYANARNVSAARLAGVKMEERITREKQVLYHFGAAGKTFFFSNGGFRVGSVFW
jgi:hypothetical protein